jgi:CRISPR/Cas system-associated exonuclease Cas4 (RecB family)
MLKRKNGSSDITASEISQYAYCPVSWYLKRSGIPPHSDGLKRGRDEHEKAGSRLALLSRQETAASIFRLLAYLCSMAAVLLLGWILWNHHF